MKRIFSAVCAVLLGVLLAGCSVPDALQLDLYQGCGNRLKLLHLNASTQERRQRIEAFERLWQDAQPLEKDIALFAYYPDYELTVTRKGQAVTVMVDINGEFVDFYYPGDTVVYRSALGVNDLKKLVHQYS